MCHCVDCKNVHGEWVFYSTVWAVGTQDRHSSRYRRFGVTPCVLVNSYRRYAVFTGSYRHFGLTPCLVVQLSTFRRYSVRAGKQLSTLRRVYR